MRRSEGERRSVAGVMGLKVEAAMEVGDTGIDDARVVEPHEPGIRGGVKVLLVLIEIRPWHL